MKTIEEIKQKIAEECAEKHFDVLFESEINVGDYKQARKLWNEVGDRYIKQFEEFKKEDKIIRANELKKGEKAKIIHWVNQPSYVGDIIKFENDTLVKIDKNGFETNRIDMRFLHFCKIELL